MPIFDLYSKRQKRNRGELPDVFQYTSLPTEFRVQVIHILRDALGEPQPYGDIVQNTFKFIHDTLCREYGLFVLTDDARGGNYINAVYNFLLKCDDLERCLDVLELSFRVVDSVAREPNYQYDVKPHIGPDQAISELNARFLEHGVGFQYESGEIMRMDSKFIHSDVVKPVLQILSDKKYAGANDEFLKAHEHYRHQRYKECLNECLKSFESLTVIPTLLKNFLKSAFRTT